MSSQESSDISQRPAGFSIGEARQGGAELSFSGHWLALRLASIDSELSLLLQGKGKLAAFARKGVKQCALNLSALEGLDTAGALAINLIRDSLLKGGLTADFTGGSPKHLELLELAKLPPEKYEVYKKISPLLITLNNIGQRVFLELKTVVAVLAFTGLLILTFGKTLVKPWTMRWTSIFYHMEQAGVMAVPIVGLLSFLIGMVLAYMSADQLTKFGAQPFVVNLLSVSLLRELGPMLTAIVVAGRSGSAYTAEIGAMVTNQEVDAMRVFGFDPIRYLVLPRVIGLLLTFPLLVFLADILGLLGGWVALWLSFGMDLFSFVSRLQEIIEVRHIWVGIAKAPVYALAVSLVGCYQGFQSTGSADSVGKLTTKSVVESIFLVIVINAIFAITYSRLGI